MAAGLDLPKKILCHSHWTVNDEKMSKSKGNVINPNELANNLATHEGLLINFLQNLGKIRLQFGLIFLQKLPRDS